MRKRFEHQLSLGQFAIEDVVIKRPKGNNRNKLDELLAALQAIYCDKKYNEQVFLLLEQYLVANKQKTGRKGMDLWSIFVLAQVRLCLNTNYSNLHNLANNHTTMRKIMGIEYEFGYKRIEYGYQNIYDNVSTLSDELIVALNKIIVSFGHEQVFKKKKETQHCA